MKRFSLVRWADRLRRRLLALRPRARVGGAGLALLVAAPLLTSCQSSDTLGRTIHADIARTLAASRQFVWTDRELGFTQTVSGEYYDAYRYHLLYVADGLPTWEEVVRDDAVADRILNPGALARYWASQRARVQIPASSVAVDALAARQWVVDSTGAPSVPTVGQELGEFKTDPFDPALLFLNDVDYLITQAPPPEVREYHPDDVTPVYKPTDDPFPPPAKGSGIVRYDVYEQPLPVLGNASPGAVPAPPTASNFTKIAVYVKNGMVVEIRLTTDPVDQLQALVNNYHLALPKGLSVQGQEAFAQAAIRRLTRNQPGEPLFLVRQETLVIQPLSAGTGISIPAGAVPGKLTFLHAA